MLTIVFNIASKNLELKLGYIQMGSAIIEAYPLKYLVADSALYTSKSLQILSLNPGIHWISRVPNTLTEAQEAIEKVELAKMRPLDEQLSDHNL
jgi:transposase